MNSLFQQVKSQVTARQAAERYGLQVSRSGMACCIFHQDKHPSMKVDRRYYCFACHATGDVIDLTAKLFGFSLYEAAKKLADAEKKAADVLAQFKANPDQNFNAWNAGKQGAQRDADRAAAQRGRNLRQAQDQAAVVAGRVFDKNGNIKPTANAQDIGRIAEQSDYLGFDNLTGRQLGALRDKRE